MMTYSNFNISDRIGMCNDRVGTCQRAYCECAQQFIEVNNNFRFWSSINSSHSFIFHKNGYFNIGRTENSDTISFDKLGQKSPIYMILSIQRPVQSLKLGNSHVSNVFCHLFFTYSFKLNRKNLTKLKKFHKILKINQVDPPTITTIRKMQC